MARRRLDNTESGGCAFVLTDINMPEMSGYRLTSDIRSLETDREHPTLIFANTGRGFDLSEEMAEKSGFNRQMPKPLDLDILERLLFQANRQ